MRLDTLILGQRAVSGFDENCSEAYETSRFLDTTAHVNEHKRKTIEEHAKVRYLAKAPDILEVITKMYDTVGN